MSHISDQELQLRMQGAQRQVVVGGRYTHYKDPTHTYRVADLGFFEETEEVCVLYQAEHDQRFRWIRLLSDFTATVEWRGKQVPRFTLVK